MEHRLCFRRIPEQWDFRTQSEPRRRHGLWQHGPSQVLSGHRGGTDSLFPLIPQLESVCGTAGTIVHAQLQPRPQRKLIPPSYRFSDGWCELHIRQFLPRIFQRQQGLPEGQTLFSHFRRSSRLAFPRQLRQARLSRNHRLWQTFHTNIIMAYQCRRWSVPAHSRIYIAFSCGRLSVQYINNHGGL